MVGLTKEQIAAIERSRQKIEGKQLRNIARKKKRKAFSNKVKKFFSPTRKLLTKKELRQIKKPNIKLSSVTVQVLPARRSQKKRTKIIGVFERIK